MGGGAVTILGGRLERFGGYMAITIICPNLTCRSVLQVADSTRGQKVRCARCGKHFRVPDSTPSKVGQEKLPAETQSGSSK